MRTPQKLPLLTLAFAPLLAAALSACSLLAPSDADLMGGAKDGSASDGGATDAGEAGAFDGANTDAAGVDADTDAACLPTGFFCNGVPAHCCSGTCNLAGGKKCD